MQSKTSPCPPSKQAGMGHCPALLGHSHAKVTEDSLLVHLLLHDETHGGEHGKAAVLQLLGLHLRELLRVGRLEAERVEANVSRVVVKVELTTEVLLDLRRRHPADKRAIELGERDGDGEDV